MISLPLVSPRDDGPTPAMIAKEERRQRKLAAKHLLDKQDQKEAEGRHFVARVASARYTAYGKKPPLLAIQLLSFTRASEWVGQPNELRMLERAERFACKMAAAAWENVCIAADIDEGKTTMAKEWFNPTIRLRFEEASCIGDLGASLYATKSKSWGRLVGIEPLPPGIIFDTRRVAYLYHENSRYNKRFNQRKYLKKRLGKGFRKLVRSAMGDTKRDFVASIDGGTIMASDPKTGEKVPKLVAANPEAAAALTTRLSMSAGEFWRAVHGKVEVEQIVEMVQGTLFEMEDS